MDRRGGVQAGVPHCVLIGEAGGPPAFAFALLDATVAAHATDNVGRLGKSSNKQQTATESKQEPETAEAAAVTTATTEAEAAKARHPEESRPVRVHAGLATCDP